MRHFFRRQRPPREGHRRFSPAVIFFMSIGILTVLYFLITYGLMPLLAMMTVS